VNVRKGLNRIFVVLWVVYGVWVIVFPVIGDLREQNAALAITNEAESLCFQDARGFEYCSKQWEAGVARDRESHKIGSSWTQFGWHLLWVVPVALCVPPLLLYGIIYGTVRIVSWIVRGFAAQPKEHPSEAG
jgi:hypothetical protein